MQARALAAGRQASREVPRPSHRVGLLAPSGEAARVARSQIALVGAPYRRSHWRHQASPLTVPVIVSEGRNRFALNATEGPGPLDRPEGPEALRLLAHQLRGRLRS